MLILSATNQSIELLLSGNVTTNQLEYTSSFIDITSTTTTPGSNAGTTSNPPTTATAVDVPGVSTTRHIKSLSIYNKDTVAATVTIQKKINTTIRILCKVTLSVGDNLIYADGEGFSVISSSGAYKTTRDPYTVISAGAQSANSGTIVFSNSNGVTFGMQNSSKISASYSSYVASYWELPYGYITTYTAVSTSAAPNISMQRFFLPYSITVTRIDLPVGMTNAGSQSGTWSISVGVYTRTQSTLNIASSTYSGVNYASTGATSQADAYAGISGTRIRSISANSWAFTPGEYWFGFINSYSNPSGTTGSAYFLGQTSLPIMAPAGAASDDVGLQGILSAASSDFPSTIQVGGAGNAIIFATNSASTGQSFVLRQPYFRMFGVEQ